MTTTTTRPAADGTDALVIFGATGDLAKLETFPALIGLVERGALDMPVVGVAKSGWGLDEFRNYAVASLRTAGLDPDSAAGRKMLALLRYVDGDLTDDKTYRAVADELPPGSKTLFYLEVPPPLFGTISDGISAAGLADGARVMVEKPFGTDLASARKLNETINATFSEENVYRVDHWIGLEALENIFVTRFANTLFEPVLNRDHVESIQITMGEEFDVSDRGAFYDRTGAIRDVIQNHMLQVLSVGLTEPPPGGGLANLRDVTSNAVRSLRPLTPADVVRGQYAGYHDVAGVAPGSTTETFAAVRLVSDSWRWDGVPILIRAGKCMPVSVTEITVKFRRPPQNVFGIEPFKSVNTLRFRVWPDTQIGLTLAGKAPGAGRKGQVNEMVFAQEPGSAMRPYDRLISAALEGRRFLFARQDAVEAAWTVVDAILDDATPVHPYAKGTWGPREADRLLPDGETWYDPRL